MVPEKRRGVIALPGLQTAHPMVRRFIFASEFSIQRQGADANTGE
ncbi:hypothetical protein [Permianibacter fluminis]|nr:hypothetical protein [Permianibacter fluminis]